jgi:hypothetical protein
MFAAARESLHMSFKFAVGQAVEYKPVGAKIGLFKVTRQMPEEFRAIDRRYRIKSEQEKFERDVLECDLNEAARLEEHSPPIQPLRQSGGH